MDALDANTLQTALAALRRGDAIGLPTETVYGLAADASNPEAVKKIFATKGRPADHPRTALQWRNLARLSDADKRDIRTQAKELRRRLR